MAKTETKDDKSMAKSPAPKSPTSPKKKSSPKKMKKAERNTISNSLELLVPPTLGNASGECSVLVQIDPEDSATLDFEGTTGAFGRFQVNSEGIILDLKGSQYQGNILPGPTAMIASLYYAADHTQELRVEAITDEFCPLVKTQDLMAKLDGQVEGTFDDSYKVQEEDVNILEKQQEQAKKQQEKQAKGKGKAATTNSTTKAKRKTPSKAAAGSANKKTKVSMGKKK